MKNIGIRLPWKKIWKKYDKKTVLVDDYKTQKKILMKLVEKEIYKYLYE